MSKSYDIITLSIFYEEGKNKNTVNNYDLENWGLGSYLKKVKKPDPDDIFNSEQYFKKGRFQLNRFFSFGKNNKYIYYQGESTFEPCRATKWFIYKNPR